MLAIPRPVLEALELTPNSPVDLSVKAGRLVVDPHKRRRRYSLDELLAQHKSNQRRSAAEREWLSGKPVGRELI
jgi:antitoxin component of MazEF toxin-antitoxin module